MSRRSAPPLTFPTPARCPRDRRIPARRTPVTVWASSASWPQPASPNCRRATSTTKGPPWPRSPGCGPPRARTRWPSPAVGAWSTPHRCTSSRRTRRPGRCAVHELQWAEQAFHTALGLWAVHQQSPPYRNAPAHSPVRRGAGRGSPAADAAPRDHRTGPQAVRPRGTAPNWPRLAQRLRDLVVLLRQHDVPLDYGLLAEQLYTWQQPGGPHTVRADWGRSFHAYRPADPGGADNDHTCDSTRSSDTDKDAS